MNSFLKATRRFERWLGEQTEIVEQDLDHKHDEMAAKSPFPFFRATFYRWMQRWPETCGELAKAPSVLAVGDLHVSNFGTWRDSEDRLVWGVNDFDEAYPLPYTQDLVRLAASALLLIDEENLPLRAEAACAAIRDGYFAALEQGGRPVLLEEDHDPLRCLVFVTWKDSPAEFWSKAAQLPVPTEPPSASADRAIGALLPASGVAYDVRTRVGGLGSLGKQRFVALAEWQGGRIGREVKAMTPSSCVWAAGPLAASKTYAPELLRSAVRCTDPLLRIDARWVARRFGPETGRIDLGQVPSKRSALGLLYAMGWETGNVHLGSKSARQHILRDHAGRRGKWLCKAARAMNAGILADWKAYRESRRGR